MPNKGDKPRLIINCDDLGWSEQANQAADMVLSDGRATSATLMVNAPCTAAAVEIIRARNYAGRIGLHLALDALPPVVDDVLRAPRLSDGKVLRVRWGLGLLAGGTRELLRREVCAQIEKCLALGVRPTHLDSHHHVHTHLLLGPIVTWAARKYSIPCVRISRNWPGTVSYKRLAKLLFNCYLGQRVITTRWFTDITSLYRAWMDGMAPLPGTIECALHPAADALKPNGCPRRVNEMQTLESDRYREFLQSYELMSFSDLAKSADGSA